MTQRLDVASDKDPLSVFYYLREHNPSPFGGYLTAATIKSSAPRRSVFCR